MIIDTRRPVAVGRKIQPNEHVTGFMTDNFTAVTNNTVASADNRYIPIRWCTPVHLSRLSSLNSVGKTTDELIMDHTNYVLKKQFSSEVDSMRLYRQLVGMHHSLGWTGESIANGPFQLAVCTQCVEEQLESAPFATWNRFHVERGVTACEIHARPLFGFCETCRSKYDTNPKMWVPPSVCVCGKSLSSLVLMKDRELGEAIAISSHAKEVARGTTSADVSAPNLRLAIRDAIGSSRRGHNRPDQLKNLMEQSLGGDMATHLGLHENTYLKFVGPESHQLITNSLTSIAIAHVVFGGITQLDEAIKRILKTDEKPTRFAPRCKATRGEHSELVKEVDALSQEEFEAVRNCLRNEILRIQAIHPNKPRAHISGGFTYGVRFLRLFDAKWLDEVLPPTKYPKSKNRNLSPEKISFYIEKFISTREKSLAKNPLKRITADLLRLPIPYSTLNLILEGNPEIRRVYDECTESPERWRARVTKLLCALVRQHDPDHFYSWPDHYDGVEINKFRAKMKSTRNWLVKRGNSLSIPPDFINPEDEECDSI